MSVARTPPEDGREKGKGRVVDGEGLMPAKTFGSFPSMKTLPMVPPTTPFGARRLRNGKFGSEAQYQAEQKTLHQKPPVLSSAFSSPVAPMKSPPLHVIPPTTSRRRVPAGLMSPRTPHSEPRRPFAAPPAARPLFPNFPAPEAPVPDEDELLRLEEIQIAEKDRVHPHIKAQNLPLTSWGKTKELALSDSNFTDWYRQLEIILGGYGHLQLHLVAADEWSRPDQHLYPMSWLNWGLNDQAVLCFMKGNLVKEEYATAEGEDIVMAIDLLKALQSCHLDRGPVTQVRLIDEALQIQFPRQRDEKAFAKVVTKLQNLNAATWAIGIPDVDTFLSMTLLRATQANHPQLFHNIKTSLSKSKATAPFTSQDVVNMIMDEVNTPSFNSKLDSANVAAVVNASTKVKGCTNCEKAGFPGARHQSEYCVRDGGGMAGKTIEEAKSKRLEDKKTREDKRHEGHFTSLSSSPLESIFESKVEVVDEVHIATETDNPSSVFDARIIGAMTEADKSEYEAIVSIESDHDVVRVVDWNTSTRDIGDLAFDAIVPPFVLA
ncbi:hypothetical protein C8J56DRAFT_896574 [Mycena floridula]|nr:hypothetical protein C8J56DRAFT_896574 [Mycena floridula]